MRMINVIAILGVLAGSAIADVQVSISGPGGSIVERQEVAGKWRVVVRATSTAAPVTFTITGDTTDPIEYIIVDADNAAQQARLVVIGASGTYDIPSVDLITWDSGSVGTVVLDDIRTSGDLGLLEAHSVVDGRIQGDILSGVVIEGGGIQNTITKLVVDGDVFGDIYADHSILDLSVGGTIGTVSAPVSVTAAGGQIRFLSAGEIYADISTLSTSFVQSIITTGVGSLNGDFVGSLTTQNLTCAACGDARRGLAIAGDLDADLFFSGGLFDPIDISGTFVANRTIRVANGTSSAADASLGASGLAGQLVINASNGSNSWSGDVTVGSTTLATKPYYSNLPSVVGGGAVGLVPYRVHGAASVPASGSTVLTDPSSVTVEYYGRLINLATGSETPMAIRKRAIASPMGEWVTVTGNYNYSVSGRTVTITPKSGQSFDGWYEWEISPVAGKLKCANTTAASDSAAADVHTGALTFSVTPTE